VPGEWLVHHWKHEIRYSLGVENDKHPQKRRTAKEKMLGLKDFAPFFKIYGI